MKKFQFSLQSVMDFKTQRLEIEKNEHAKALAKVNEQEKRIEDLQQQYVQVTNNFDAQKMSGITVIEANIFIMTMETLIREIDRQKLVLKQFKEIEEQRRQIVVETKIETSSLEKIREKKYEEYLEMEKKSDELFIEEFVSRQKFMEG